MGLGLACGLEKVRSPWSLAGAKRGGGRLLWKLALIPDAFRVLEKEGQATSIFSLPAARALSANARPQCVLKPVDHLHSGKWKVSPPPKR